MSELCPHCGGLLDPGSDFLWCGHCQEGWQPEDIESDDYEDEDNDLDFGLDRDSWEAQQSRICPYCDGTGFCEEELGECSECGGMGIKPEHW